MTQGASVESFYREGVPSQWNASLTRQRASAKESTEDATTLAEMEAVRASIVVRVIRSEGIFDCAFDIERGEMTLAESPAYPPFLILSHAESDFACLRKECGESLLGFLGGLAGLGGEMKLTSQRVRSLRELDGTIAFERLGDDGFRLVARFGKTEEDWRAAGDVEEHANAPVDATIRIDADTHHHLKTGQLDPQDAFLSGKIETLGDESRAVGLALAALAPS